MTRLNILNDTLSLPSIPASVALGELAITAGVAGHATTLSFCDFDAPVLSELWKHFSRFAGTDDVHHVRGQSDVRKLAQHAAEFRLVFVHAPRLHNPAAWAIQLAMPSDGEPSQTGA